MWPLLLKATKEEIIMSHASSLFSTKEKKNILPMANEFAYYNCDRYENPDGTYHGNMKIFENKIFSCVEDADAFIERYSDAGDYRDCAVRYYDTIYVDSHPTKKLTNLMQQITKLQEAKKDFEKESRVQNRKSKSITCPKCGSRLSLDYLKGNICPLCETDLRSDTVLSRLKSFDERIVQAKKQYRQALEEARKNCRNKNSILWRFKVEVHC